MLTVAGRPRKACGTCKAQKIRCTGERPSCKRCLRLKHACIYNGLPFERRAESHRSPRPALDQARRPSTPSAPSATGGKECSTTSVFTQLAKDLSASPVLLSQPAAEERYLGIPKALLATLIELYFGNVYHAHLLLHKRSFEQSLALGTARPHVVLAICAWGASFYRDPNGQATLEDHGFMIEWAQRASQLVFQELPEFQDDSLVTFVTSSIFWHSQGSWRMSILHKGSACNLFTIIGIGSGVRQQDNTWESEIRRRRSWSTHLLHCHNSEALSTFAVAGMEKLALPWPEADFEAGRSSSARVTLYSGQSNGGVYAEVIRILTFWASAVTCIKTAEPSLATKLPAMYSLHEKLSDWWNQLPPGMQLTASNVAAVPDRLLPNILLMNVVYHQCLCALHASIVPLFSWGKGDSTWCLARQLSAQLAYEHACTISELLSAVLATFDRISAMPSFICYGAYAGCAIQIPFMWSSNRAVRERAHANVKANMKMINAMSEYWKFVALLKVYVRCLYNRHKKHPTILEDEPKYVDVAKLTNFKVNAPHAQASILEFIGILHNREDGYVKPGEEAGLDIEHVEPREPPSRRDDAPEVALEVGHAKHTMTSPIVPQDSRWTQPAPSFPPLPPSTHPIMPATPESEVQHQHQQHQSRHRLSSPQQPQHAQIAPCLSSSTFQVCPPPPVQQPQLPDHQPLDIFHPLFDPEMLDLFPNGEWPDLSAFDTSPLNLDYFEFDNWTGAD